MSSLSEEMKVAVMGAQIQWPRAAMLATGEFWLFAHPQLPPDTVVRIAPPQTSFSSSLGNGKPHTITYGRGFS